MYVLIYSTNAFPGNCTSLSLDLYDQWVGLESNGQFRFTPPTHSIVSFYEALKELEAEGGVSARFNRLHAIYSKLCSINFNALYLIGIK